jgi:epoxyqueuosine reductase
MTQAQSSAPPLTDLRDGIVGQALELGFDSVGVVRANTIVGAGERLADFLALGWHGDMAWMMDNADRRADPQVLWPAVKSIVVVGMNYGSSEDPLAVLEETRLGAISVSAQGRDYHDLIKKRLKQLARWMIEAYGGDVKVFVDTAPVMEKPLAAAAGLGWQGKHTNLVSRNHGSWLFIGSVFTTLEVPTDLPGQDNCGSCHACLDICPTNAFPAPYQLEARRCISYLTIEHKGHIARDLRTEIGNRIFGCDDCLAVCPWNKYAKQATELRLQPRPELTAPSLAELSRLDDVHFRTLFSGSNIKRTGRDRFIRNVLIAIGNSNCPDLADDARDLLDDPSPLVRAMAVWALSELLDENAFQLLRNDHYPHERDSAVCAEWEWGQGNVE